MNTDEMKCNWGNTYFRKFSIRSKKTREVKRQRYVQCEGKTELKKNYKIDLV